MKSRKETQKEDMVLLSLALGGSQYKKSITLNSNPSGREWEIGEIVPRNSNLPVDKRPQ